MPTFTITSRVLHAGWNTAPVLWFVPDNMPTVREVDAPTARDAVMRLMAIDGLRIEADEPVRGSAILHRWFFPRTVTTAAYIDEFLAGRRRFSYQALSMTRRVLSVAEKGAPTGASAHA
jgi:hypothetical protein